MDKMLYQISNALKDETAKIVKHASGYDPDISDLQLFHNKQYEYAFGSMFQVKTLGPRGETTYTISISEATK